MERIDEQLTRWGNFVMGRECYGVGYPKRCPTFNLDPRSSCGTLTLIDAVIGDIDRIVMEFASTYPELFRVAFCWYAFGMPYSVCAHHCGCSEKTVYRRIERLKEKVKERLNFNINKNVCELNKKVYNINKNVYNVPMLSERESFR